MKALVYTAPDGQELQLDPMVSAAFSPSLVEDWNRRATAIQPPLFCFAYYEPRAWVSESPEAGFLRAVANLYGLLVDCGYLVKAVTTGRCLMRYFTEPELAQLTAFYNNICSLRTVLFHNPSTGNNPINARHQAAYKAYLCGNPNQETTWSQALVQLLRDTEQFEHVMDSFLKKIEELPPEQQKGVSAVWRKYILLRWYQSDKDMFFGQTYQAYSYWIRDTFSSDELNRQQRSRSMPKELTDWVKRYVEYKGGSIPRGVDVLEYTQKTFFAQAMEQILQRADIPMLPSDFYQELFEEARQLRAVLK